VAWTRINVDEITGAGPGGMVKFVRRELGVEACGINWYELPPGTEGREHNETETGQEEVNVIVRGGGVYLIDGMSVPCRQGDFFRFDPATTRQPVAGPDGLIMIAVGVKRGSYEQHGPF
jgi:hypothetical protein